MAEFTPTTEQARAGYAYDVEEFDRWLAVHDREVRAQALEDMADVIHSEARWQREQYRLGAWVNALDRTGLLERIARNRATAIRAEGSADGG